jgi:hypothetical protein
MIKKRKIFEVNETTSVAVNRIAIRPIPTFLFVRNDVLHR